MGVEFIPTADWPRIVDVSCLSKAKEQGTLGMVKWST